MLARCIQLRIGYAAQSLAQSIGAPDARSGRAAWCCCIGECERPCVSEENASTRALAQIRAHPCWDQIPKSRFAGDEAQLRRAYPKSRALWLLTKRRGNLF